ncbi:hypothetical protein ACQ86N_21895 [Puia sp. P3]|uniref:hypothetical protein n=1 Tax=Puia sp. P3 TaxID=3423952 RepID=UPI003D66D8D3
MYGIKILTLFFCLALARSINRPLCNCEGELGTSDAVKYADCVFKGTVISKSAISNPIGYGIKILGDTLSHFYRFTKAPIAVYQIKVEKLFKGKSSSDTLTIMTPVNGAACGFIFDSGERYIVYATKEDETIPGDKIKRISTSDKIYWTNMCTRTAQWSQTEENEILKIK